MKIIQILLFFSFPSFASAQMVGTYLTLKFGKPYLTNPSTYKVDGLNHSSSLNFGIGFENDYVFKGRKNLSLNWGVETNFNQFNTNWNNEVFYSNSSNTWLTSYENDLTSFDLQFPVGINLYYENLFFSTGITYVYHVYGKMDSELKFWTSDEPNNVFETLSNDQKICNPWFTTCRKRPAWETPFELWMNGTVGYEYAAIRFELLLGFNLTRSSLDDFAEDGITIDDLNDNSLLAMDSGKTVGTNFLTLSFQVGYRLF